MSGAERTKMILVKATLQPLYCGGAKSNSTRCCYGRIRPKQRWWLV